MNALSLVWRLVVGPMKRLLGPRRWDCWHWRYWTLRQKLIDRVENWWWRVSSPRIFIVSEVSDAVSRHFYWHFLSWLGRERPSLRAHIHLDRLTCHVPPGTNLLHAWVPDPVLERNPRVYVQLVELEAECARRSVPVVHPARVLSNSNRDVLCERLGRTGVRTPRIAVVDEAFDAHRGGLSLPMVVRRRWGHNVDMLRLDAEASFRRWWALARTDPSSWVAGEYVDVRSGDGWYRKYRYLMAGSRGISRHLIVSPNWEVRPADRVRTQATREEELAFVAVPSPHHALFDAARLALEFEIAAFDYSYDPNGALVVWEVNPYPDLSRPAGDVGDYLAATVERSYAMLADFYAERAGMAGQ